MPACHICQQTLYACTVLLVFQGLAMCRRIRISLYQFFDSYTWQHPFGDWYASLLICSYCSTNASGTASWFSGTNSWVRHPSPRHHSKMKKKKQSYWGFFYRRRINGIISMCTARNHAEELLILCTGEKKKEKIKEQDLCCFKHCLTSLTLGLNVQNDGTSTISQDNGSKSVFKPDFSRERRVDLAPTHTTLKRCEIPICNPVAQLVLRAWFPMPCLGVYFSCCQLGSFHLCHISEVSATSLETACQSHLFIFLLKSAWRAECSLNNFSHIDGLFLLVLFLFFNNSFLKRRWVWKLVQLVNIMSMSIGK